MRAQTQFFHSQNQNKILSVFPSIRLIFKILIKSDDRMKLGQTLSTKIKLSFPLDPMILTSTETLREIKRITIFMCELKSGASMDISF